MYEASRTAAEFRVKLRNHSRECNRPLNRSSVIMPNHGTHAFKQVAEGRRARETFCAEQKGPEEART
eukprot:6773806-Heterocapsa_arctica.AAC.1